MKIRKAQIPGRMFPKFAEQGGMMGYKPITAMSHKQRIYLRMAHEPGEHQARVKRQQRLNQRIRQALHESPFPGGGRVVPKTRAFRSHLGVAWQPKPMGPPRVAIASPREFSRVAGETSRATGQQVSARKLRRGVIAHERHHAAEMVARPRYFAQQVYHEAAAPFIRSPRKVAALPGRSPSMARGAAMHAAAEGRATTIGFNAAGPGAVSPGYEQRWQRVAKPKGNATEYQQRRYRTAQAYQQGKEHPDSLMRSKRRMGKALTRPAGHARGMDGPAVVSKLAEIDPQFTKLLDTLFPGLEPAEVAQRVYKQNPGQSDVHVPSTRWRNGRGRTRGRGRRDIDDAVMDTRFVNTERGLRHGDRRHRFGKATEERFGKQDEGGAPVGLMGSNTRIITGGGGPKRGRRVRKDAMLTANHPVKVKGPSPKTLRNVGLATTAIGTGMSAYGLPKHLAKLPGLWRGRGAEGGRKALLIGAGAVGLHTANLAGEAIATHVLHSQKPPGRNAVLNKHSGVAKQFYAWRQAADMLVAAHRDGKIDKAEAMELGAFVWDELSKAGQFRPDGFASHAPPDAALPGPTSEARGGRSTGKARVAYGDARNPLGGDWVNPRWRRHHSDQAREFEAIQAGGTNVRAALTNRGGLAKHDFVTSRAQKRSAVYGITQGERPVRLGISQAELPRRRSVPIVFHGRPSGGPDSAHTTAYRGERHVGGHRLGGNFGNRRPVRKAAGAYSAFRHGIEAGRGIRGVKLIGDPGQATEMKANLARFRPAFRHGAHFGEHGIKYGVGGTAAVGYEAGKRRTPTAKSAGDTFDFEASGEFAKLDEEKMQAFGWCSVVKIDGKDVIDKQNDLIDIADLEPAAYEYVVSSRKAGNMHQRGLDGVRQVGHMIESMVFTPEKIEKLGLPTDFPQGWWIGQQYTDPETWAEVREGKKRGFSIHGTGIRKLVEVDEEPLGERQQPVGKGSDLVATVKPPKPKPLAMRGRLGGARNTQLGGLAKGRVKKAEPLFPGGVIRIRRAVPKLRSSPINAGPRYHPGATSINPPGGTGRSVTLRSPQAPAPTGSAGRTSGTAGRAPGPSTPGIRASRRTLAIGGAGLAAGGYAVGHRQGRRS